VIGCDRRHESGRDAGELDVVDQGVDANAIRNAVELFYERVLADPELSPLFSGIDMPTLHAHQRLFLLHILGGPDRYSSQDIKDAHSALLITDRLLDRMIAHLVASLGAVGVAQDVVERATTDIEALRPIIVTAT
jgi:hemoglobin